MKKWLKTIGVAVFFVLLFGGYFWFNSLSKTVDCSGFVEAIRLDSEKECAFVTVKQDSSDVMYEIEIPYSWKCKTPNDDKFLIADLKVGDEISLNFKNDTVYKDGIYYAEPKGTVMISPHTQS